MKPLAVSLRMAPELLECALTDADLLNLNPIEDARDTRARLQAALQIAVARITTVMTVRGLGG